MATDSYASNQGMTVPDPVSMATFHIWFVSGIIFLALAPLGEDVAVVVASNGFIFLNYGFFYWCKAYRPDIQQSVWNLGAKLRVLLITGSILALGIARGLLTIEAVQLGLWLLVVTFWVPFTALRFWVAWTKQWKTRVLGLRLY
jgi:hypothetical protein